MSFTFREALALQVEKKPCLWDPSCDNYHDTSARNHAWSEVADNLLEKGYACDVEDLKAKWRSMRSAYKRFQNVRSGSPAVKPEGIYRLLSYLDVGECRSVRMTNIDLEEDLINDDSGVATYERRSSQENLAPVQLLGKRSLYEKRTPAKKVKPGIEEHNAILEAVDAVKKQVSNIQNMDKYTHFGNFVGESLRNMPDDVSDEKMNVIMTTLISKIQYVECEEVQQNASDTSS